MMMKRKNIFVCLVAVVMTVFSATSCLDKFPYDAYPQENAMETFSDAEQVMIGIYSAFKSSSLYSGNLTILPDLQADFVYAVDGFSNTYGDIWQWKILATDRDIEAVYASLYGVIGRCNFYLDKVDALREKLTDDDDIDYLDQYTGEVHTARALAYSELVKCFCEAYDNDEDAKEQWGVVIKKSYFKDEPAKRASLYDSYAFILEDLTKAEELLDEDYDVAANVWFSYSAVCALRARVALYMKDWDAAVEYAGKVIDHENKPFALASASTLYGTDSSGNTWTEYQYMWDYDSGSEVIWKVAFETTSYGGSLGSIFLGFTRDYTTYYPDYVPATWAINLYSSSDLRQSAFFASLQTGYPHGLAWPLLVKYYGNRQFIAQNIYHINMPKVFRLAELYLIRAEAYCNLGEYGKASDDLTTLRKKRFSANGGEISLSEEDWLDEISDERVRELYMEGFRLHDLKRWGRGFEREPQESSLQEGSSLKISGGDYRFVWPIPRNEIEAPGSEIKQNKGY